jgi:hypothetical protein
MPPNDEKLSEELKLRLGSTMYLDASREAARENRSLPDYFRHVMSLHLYGVTRKVSDGQDEG